LYSNINLKIVTHLESKNIFNGLKWASIELVFDSIIKFSLKLLLAKLLLPEDFGLLGMCMIFIGIISAISRMGIGAALIQKKTDQEAETLYNTAFWTNIFLAIAMYLIISFVLGPIIAWFYEEPMLKNIIPILSLSIISQPLSLIHGTILTRKLDFKKLSKAYNLSTLISGIIAITTAFLGFGVWALVIDYVLSTSIAIPILMVFTKWKPKLEWKKTYFYQIFGFGAYSTGTSIIRSIANSVDYLIIGKLLGSSLLGSYTLAFMLTNQLKSFLSRTVNKVMYPVFSKFQDDPVKLKSFFFQILKVNSIMIYPVMAFLVYFGEDVILTFFGNKWVEAVLPLKILAFAMLIELLGNAIDTILRAKGKPKLELKILTQVNLLVLVPGIFLGVYFYDLVGASVAVLINTVVYVYVCISALRKEMQIQVSDFLMAIKPATIGIISSVLFTAFIAFVIGNIPFLVLECIFLILYGIVIYYFEINYLKQILKKFT
jgi:teichuronic acid exporter